MAPATATDHLEAFLKRNPSIKYIRFQWVDYSGVLRARFVPVARALQIARGESTLGLSQAGMLIPIATAPRSFSLSDRHETCHGTAMAFVSQQDAMVHFDKCPRHLLLDAVHRFAHRFDNARVSIGFEIEIVLLDERDEPVRPMDRLNGYSRTAGLRGDSLKLVEEIADALKRAFIDVWQFHPELDGQLEIALAAQPPLEAVDSLVLAQEIIRTVCVRHNIKAAMGPKPTRGGPSNGLHMHLSVGDLGRLAPVDSFAAGVLEHMGALSAFGMANYDSYGRAVGDAAGEWIGLGTDNRDLPVRRVADGHWEFRTLDSTANPYLFAAAVVLAGTDGLLKETPLAWKDCKFFPHLLDASRREEFGLWERMPGSLKEALGCLKSDAVVKSWVGENLLRWYISVKDKEVDEFGKMTDEQRMSRFLEYF